MAESFRTCTESSFQDFQHTQITCSNRNIHRLGIDRFYSERGAQKANHFINTSFSTSLYPYKHIDLEANGT